MSTTRISRARADVEVDPVPESVAVELADQREFGSAGDDLGADERRAVADDENIEAPGELCQLRLGLGVARGGAITARRDGEPVVPEVRGLLQPREVGRVDIASPDVLAAGKADLRAWPVLSHPPLGHRIATEPSSRSGGIGEIDRERRVLAQARRRRARSPGRADPVRSGSRREPRPPCPRRPSKPGASCGMCSWSSQFGTHMPSWTCAATATGPEGTACGRIPAWKRLGQRADLLDVGDAPRDADVGRT